MLDELWTVASFKFRVFLPLILWIYQDLSKFFSSGNLIIISNFIQYSGVLGNPPDGHESNWSHFEMDSQFIGLVDMVMKISSNQMDLSSGSKKDFLIHLYLIKAFLNLREWLNSIYFVPFFFCDV